MLFHLSSNFVLMMIGVLGRTGSRGYIAQHSAVTFMDEVLERSFACHQMESWSPNEAEIKDPPHLTNTRTFFLYYERASAASGASSFVFKGKI